MGKVKDMVGTKTGLLTAVKRAGSNKTGKATWLCRCDCGKETIVCGADMSSGKVSSCGCKTGEKHGLADTPLYTVYKGIKGRCYNENHSAFSGYGGRGIKMCDDWKMSFVAFREWCIENGWSKGLQIDRKNGDLGYSPENCRIVTPAQNVYNTSGLKSGTSKYKGVSFKTKSGKWVAQIRKGDTNRHIGYFATEEEAALAYNEKAKELFGEYAYLNNISKGKCNG